jgi:hypothetical protein
VLGRSVVLHGYDVDADADVTAWLTPADLPRDVLRKIRVRVQARRAAAAR